MTTASRELSRPLIVHGPGVRGDLLSHVHSYARSLGYEVVCVPDMVAPLPLPTVPIDALAFAPVYVDPWPRDEWRRYLDTVAIVAALARPR